MVTSNMNLEERFVTKDFATNQTFSNGLSFINSFNVGFISISNTGIFVIKIVRIIQSWTCSVHVSLYSNVHFQGLRSM